MLSFFASLITTLAGPFLVRRARPQDLRTVERLAAGQTITRR